MISLSSLSPATRERLNGWRWDRIIEKHEGPEDWASTFRYTDAEFISIDGRDVLLPLDAEQRPNVTILRTIVSEDQRTLTIFLKDTTYVENPRDEVFMAGFVAICDRLPREEFFGGVVFYERFMVAE